MIAIATGLFLLIRAPDVEYFFVAGYTIVQYVVLATAWNILGGYGARGRSQQEQDKIMSDAEAVAGAGAFAMVLEGVIEPIGRAVTETTDIPIIGIGASAACDGQVLVAEDMLGLFERTPRFVKRFGDMADRISEAAAAYAADVRSRAFPTPDQTYQPKPGA